MLHLSSVTGWLARLKVAYTQAILGPPFWQQFQLFTDAFLIELSIKKTSIAVFLFNWCIWCNKKCVPDRFSRFDIF